MLTLIFLTQVLCAMVPCDPKFTDPEITRVDNPVSGRISRRGFLNLNLWNNEVKINPIHTVQTTTGKVAGFNMESKSGHMIYAFEGIPYAEPPVGLNRFQPPVPKKPWIDVLPAKKRGNPCLQLSPVKLYRTIGKEDCLTLNVYSSMLTTEVVTPKLPVLIWIHGGAYLFSEGADYGPSYLLDEDVVLITLNYRLGILGFLSTGDAIIPGNNGLRDQALAIKWVHDNIENFGGDANRVTLLGHSAGGASVHLHMMSKLNTKNYFQSAVSFSGTAMNNWAMNKPSRARMYLNKVANIVNCPGLKSKQSLRQSNQTVECLRSKNPNTLVNSQFRLLEWGPFPIVMFGPVVEKPNRNAFLTKKPKDIYAQNGVAKIPWIASFTKEEGLFQLLLIYGNMKIPEFKSQWSKSAPYALDLVNVVKNPGEVSQKVQDFYFKDEPLNSISYARLSDPITDRFFIKGIHEAITAHSQVAPTYGYVFDYLGKHNVGNYLGLDAKEWGIGHSEDIFYIFNSSTIYHGFTQNDKKELELSQTIVKLLTSFAANGKPIVPLTGIEKEEVIWTSVNSNASNPQLQFLQIGSELKMIPEPFKERREFWESLNIKDL